MSDLIRYLSTPPVERQRDAAIARIDAETETTIHRLRSLAAAGAAAYLDATQLSMIRTNCETTAPEVSGHLDLLTTVVEMDMAAVLQDHGRRLRRR